MRIAFVSTDFEIESLAFGYLGSYLKEAEHETMLYKLNDPRGLEVLRDFDPEVLGYSVTTGFHNFYKNTHVELNRSLGTNLLGIFGGAHPTFFPEFSSQLTNGIIVRGEGYESLVEIVDCLELHGEVPKDLANTSDNKLRPLVDKTHLLLPDRNLMYSYASNYNNPIKNVMCSFGCKFSCPYCYNSFYRKLYENYTQQLRIVSSIKNELVELQQYPLKLVYFQDDLFPVFSVKWLDEFCQMYSEYKVPFHVQLRAEFITEKSIQALKEVGLHGVTFAVESGNSDFRFETLKRFQSDDTIKKAAGVLRKYKLNFRIENMLGAPGESFSQAIETVKLNHECRPTLGWASLFQPYPRTILGDKAIAEGLFDGDVDKIGVNFSDEYILEVKDRGKFIKLQNLFGLAVRFGFVYKMLPLLVNLPLAFLYAKLGKLFKQFSYKHKLYHVRRRTT